MHHGGSVALLGIPPGRDRHRLEPGDLKGLNMRGIYGREMFETWYKMAALLQAGLDITPVITHHFPIQEFQRDSDHGVWAVGESNSRLGRRLTRSQDNQDMTGRIGALERRAVASSADVAEAVGVAIVPRVHARPARQLALQRRELRRHLIDGTCAHHFADEVLREPDLDLQRQ